MKLVFLLYALFVRSCTSVKPKVYAKVHPSIAEDSKLNTPSLIKKYGYPVEIHTVTTQDGYVLQMHRIPHGKAKRYIVNGTAVFLQHGLFGSSGDWVLTGPNKGFAFLLADAGYDVWLGNARGNRYSRKHIKLDPDKDKKKFWNFTWHEIGISDLPAMIDYVIGTTGQGRIFYVGHSQGTTSFFVMASERPEYNYNIRAMFAFSPAAYVANLTSPYLRFAMQFVSQFETGAVKNSHYELLPHGHIISEMSASYCADDSPVQAVCINLIFSLTGVNRKQLNTTIIPVIAGHKPAGASIYQVFHYAQLINSGRFCQYDYGNRKNVKKYGSESPPDYNLGNIIAPVYLHYSLNDWLSNNDDVMKLAEELPNEQMSIVPDPEFNYIDYLYANEAPELLYIRVMTLMRKHL